jgi:hypothetical protein
MNYNALNKSALSSLVVSKLMSTSTSVFTNLILRTMESEQKETLFFFLIYNIWQSIVYRSD